MRPSINVGDVNLRAVLDLRGREKRELAFGPAKFQARDAVEDSQRWSLKKLGLDSRRSIPRSRARVVICVLRCSDGHNSPLARRD